MGANVHSRCLDDCGVGVELCDTDAECSTGTCAAHSCPQTLVTTLKACTKPGFCN